MYRYPPDENQVSNVTDLDALDAEAGANVLQ